MAISSIGAEFKITDKLLAERLAQIITSSQIDRATSETNSVILSSEDAVNVFKAIQNKLDIS